MRSALEEMKLNSKNRLIGRGAFTLIELLVAMGIVLILASFSLVIMPGLFEGQKEKKARADIAVIQTALEQYRTRFGTYPKPTATLTDMGYLLFNALNGKISGQGDATQVKPMLNLSVLDTATSNMPNFDDDTATSWVNNRVIDPWGNEYVYRYGPGVVTFTNWNNFRYVLFSMGEDAEYADVSADGTYDPDDTKNLDNINAQ